MVSQNTFLELYKPDLHESGWWLLTDTAALSSPPGPLLPGACQGPSLVTVFGHIRLLSCFLLLFPPLEEKKSESNHKVSHLLFRNIFVVVVPDDLKIFFWNHISPYEMSSKMQYFACSDRIYISWQ